jgi:branched-chain amino acid transport system ATP-binding protein
MSTLAADAVEAGYGELSILWGASVALREGRLTTIVGSNGSGKTTLLRAIMGLLPVRAGTVTFDGRDITRLTPHEKARLGLVLVPEGRQLFTKMTVVENLEMGATPGRARASMQASYDEVFALFPRLAERRRQAAGTLSGGEQQMLAIARGLMAKPAILLLDEPSLGLSPVVVLELFRVIRDLRRGGLTMCLVEQNVQLSLAIADDAYVMRHGRVEISGDAATVREMPEVRKAYLGAL